MGKPQVESDNGQPLVVHCYVDGAIESVEVVVSSSGADQGTENDDENTGREAPPPTPAHSAELMSNAIREVIRSIGLLAYSIVQCGCGLVLLYVGLALLWGFLFGK